MNSATALHASLPRIAADTCGVGSTFSNSIPVNLTVLEQFSLLQLQWPGKPDPAWPPG